MQKQQNKNVAVVGLGSMGKKLVELLQAHFEVVVWNRTASKAHELVGVQVANSPEDSFCRTETVVMCLYDYAAVRDVLNGIKDKRVLAGRTLINFTTGSPEEASEIESFISAYQGHYINGALEVAPDQMGLAHTTILLSGNEDAYKKRKAC